MIFITVCSNIKSIWNSTKCILPWVKSTFNFRTNFSPSNYRSDFYILCDFWPKSTSKHFKINFKWQVLAFFIEIICKL